MKTIFKKGTNFTGAKDPEQKRCFLQGQTVCTVNSRYSRHARGVINLVSVIARIRNSGGHFQSNFFCRGSGFHNSECPQGES